MTGPMTDKPREFRVCEHQLNEILRNPTHTLEPPTECTMFLREILPPKPEEVWEHFVRYPGYDHRWDFWVQCDKGPTDRLHCAGWPHKLFREVVEK